MRSRRKTCRGTPTPASSGCAPRWRSPPSRGGFVLLVGGSSVGKTRTAVEAVQSVAARLVAGHPARADQVTALAAAPSPRTVVWLDELQRYLEGEHGLTGGDIRALLDAPHPVVIIGTLWPDRYAAYTAVPASCARSRTRTTCGQSWATSPASSLLSTPWTGKHPCGSRHR